MGRSAFFVFVFSSLSLLDFAFAGDPAWYEHWERTYGCQVLAPEDIHLAERIWDNGWTGRLGSKEGIVLYIAHKTDVEERSQIERFGTGMVGVAQDRWRCIGRKRSEDGWEWFRAVIAHYGSSVYLAGYGSASDGEGHVCVLRIGNDEFKENRSFYEQWCSSIELR